MKPSHDPAPGFAQSLEAELLRSGRRRELFEQLQPTRSLKFLKLAVLVAASVFVGAAGVVAAERIQEAERAELLLARARIKVETAKERIALVRLAMEESLKLKEQGFLGESEFMNDQRRVEEAEVQMNRFILDLAEIQESKAAPNDELSAPLQGGRDFVLERLALDRQLAALTMEQSRSVCEYSRRLLESGYISEREVRQDEMAAQMAESDLKSIEERMSWRSKFIKGELTPAKVQLLGLQSLARRRIEAAQAQSVHLREILELTKSRYEAGITPQSAVLKAELAFREAEAEFKLAELELRVLADELNR